MKYLSIKTILLSGLLTLASASLNEAYLSIINNNAPKAEKLLQDLRQSEKDSVKIVQICQAQIFVAEYLENDSLSNQATACIADFATTPEQAFANYSFLNRAYTNSEHAGLIMKKFSRFLNDERFGGYAMDALLSRSLNDGDTASANQYRKDLNLITNWKMLGPFPNRNNRSIDQKYVAEKEIDFSKEYQQKDGKYIRWIDIHAQASNGWIFLNNLATDFHSLNYFYSEVHSPKDQIASLRFGHSGTFRLFVNDSLVMEDLEYRNTPADFYQRPVRLKKGINRILLKIGHEKRVRAGEYDKSNFQIRFSQAQGLKYASEITQSPGKIQFYYPKNLNSFDQNIFAPSIAKYEKLYKEHPEKPQYFFRLLQLYQMTSQEDHILRISEDFYKKYPQSSSANMMLMLAKQSNNEGNEAYSLLDKALELDPSNSHAWKMKINRYINREEWKAARKALDQAPQKIHDSFLALQIRMVEAAEKSDMPAMMSLLDEMDKKHYTQETAVGILATIYSKMNKLPELKDLYERSLKHDQRNKNIFALKLNLIGTTEGIPAMIQAMEDRIPLDYDNPNIDFTIANTHAQNNHYQKAYAAIVKAIQKFPLSPNILLTKANIHNALGQKDSALNELKRLIRYTSNDFIGYDRIREINGQKKLIDYLQLPNRSKLIEKYKQWKPNNGKFGNVLSYYKDVIAYPSRRVQTRVHLIKHLPTQDAVDNSIETDLYYNGLFQTLEVNKAISFSENGNEVPADRNGYQLVFKNLKPGDYIEIEYTLKSYFQDDLADEIWGDLQISNATPFMESELRILRPKDLEIPVTILNKSVQKSTEPLDELILEHYRIEKRQKATNEKGRRYGDWAPSLVKYSTMKSWNDIAKWYQKLSHQDPSTMKNLQKLADSLFNNQKTIDDKVRRLHHYIVSNIRYSYVPFRQSGWIPQHATSTLDNKIGDCKDMANLGVQLLRMGGISANMVLVHTKRHSQPEQLTISPEFNHAILVWKNKEGKQSFIDYTHPTLNYKRLPLSDQNALALIIDSQTKNLIQLPHDKPEHRVLLRQVSDTLSADGSFKRTVKATRTGIHAASTRNAYRDKSISERKKALKNAVQGNYPNALVDYYQIAEKDLKGFADSLQYEYAYSATETIQKVGKTMIFSVHMPDKFDSPYAPITKDRQFPYSPYDRWDAVSTQISELDFHFPKEWKVLDYPESIKFKSKWAEYQLDIQLKKGKMHVKRHLTIKNQGIIAPKDYPKYSQFFNKLYEADQIQLLFKKK